MMVKEKTIFRITGIIMIFAGVYLFIHGIIELYFMMMRLGIESWKVKLVITGTVMFIVGALFILEEKIHSKKPQRRRRYKEVKRK